MPKTIVPTNRMIPMIANQSNPLIANPTTDKTAQATNRTTITVHMSVKLSREGTASEPIDSETGADYGKRVWHSVRTTKTARYPR